MTQPAIYGAQPGLNAPAYVVGPYYGSFGQGDDTTAIANAMDAANQAGGGRVIIPGFPDGGYVVKASQVAVPRWVHLSGLSWNSYGATGGMGRLQQLSGVNDDFIIFKDPGLGGSDAQFVGPQSITDLIIRGALGATSGHGICGRKNDGTVGAFMDLSAFERLQIRGFAKSGIYTPKCSPVVISNIATLFNGGYGLEFVDDGSDAASGRLHHISISNISGDGNMGYASDADGATVYVKGMSYQFALNMRGIKSEYRIRNTDSGGDGTGMGNAHAIVLENCTAAVSVMGVTHIANGTQTRRPDSAILVKGTGRPNLVWSAVALRSAQASQTGTAGPPVRDDVQGTSYTTSSGTLGPETDAAAVELASGEATMERRAVNSVSSSTGNGNLRLTYFTARRTETISTVRVPTGGTAGVGATLNRIGVYSVDPTSGDLTLIASTANDTALWTAANATYTKTLSATFSKKRGTRYAVGVLVVGSTTAPTLNGQTFLNGPEAALPPRLNGLVSGQTDLPSTVAAASVGSTGIQTFAALIP